MGKGRNKNDDWSCSRNRSKSFENEEGVAPWSDLHGDVLLLVMMQLGVVDFLSFSAVCKSWRSLAVSNKKTFLASKPPMLIDAYRSARNQGSSYWYLADFEGRSFKTTLPHSAGRICCGSTSGYLILYCDQTRDIWLVNPITRHELHFPDYPLYAGGGGIRAILVFSASISAWVFVMLANSLDVKISYSIEGKRGWNHVPSPTPIMDLHAFKGKIYTLHIDYSLHELKLNLKGGKGITTLLEIKNNPNPNVGYAELVSSDENLYMVESGYPSSHMHVMELVLGEMECVSPKTTIPEYAFLCSPRNKSSAAIKLGPWIAPRTRYGHSSPPQMFYPMWMWYFPHDSLNVHFLDESSS